MTNLTNFQKKVRDLLPAVELKFDEMMSKHTSFRIGGAVEVMAFPKNVEELSEVVKVSELLDCKTAILGAGTNVLAPDKGLRGIIICLKDCLDGIELLENQRLYVMAGVTMTRAAVAAANYGLSGLEFAHGIPGTVGGGIYMNAGAYGGEIGEICESVDVMNRDGTVCTWRGAEMGFSYRHSNVEERHGIVVGAVFQLVQKPEMEIRGRMRELMGKRSASQPLSLPSAGSAFKRPAGGYAAALIDQAGLKGFTVGGAGISEKHAGFAVNLGGATAGDVTQLLKQVSDIVYEKTGIRLEPEIRIW